MLCRIFLTDSTIELSRLLPLATAPNWAEAFALSVITGLSMLLHALELDPDTDSGSISISMPTAITTTQAPSMSAAT